jgi:hypothetical protein
MERSLPDTRFDNEIQAGIFQNLMLQDDEAVRSATASLAEWQLSSLSQSENSALALQVLHSFCSQLFLWMPSPPKVAAVNRSRVAASM